MRMKLILATLFLAAAIPAFSQIEASAKGTTPRFAVGAGFSDYSSDWSGRYAGGALWADWNPNLGPSLLHGLGIEIEARDLSFGQTKDKYLRLDTIGGGAIYTVRHYRKIHPYGKFLMSYASFDFNPYNLGKPDQYSHDTRTDYAPGGGVEYHAWRDVWVRADYEYQFFVDFFNHHAMNPNGFTIGASYEFGRPRQEY